MRMLYLFTQFVSFSISLATSSTLTVLSACPTQTGCACLFPTWEQGFPSCSLFTDLAMDRVYVCILGIPLHRTDFRRTLPQTVSFIFQLELVGLRL